MDLPARALNVAACRRECAWSSTGDAVAGETLFACDSCGSEWVRSQRWTPIDWAGVVPKAVLAERERHTGTASGG